ncbi:hypothetical protein PRIPAC_77850, partial [Pristionchus pacificus]|uniref:RING-type domain-containing protein n=1 Tax=Pristionchus pacificus TaxID=54126 RepID=A0A8R1ZBR0_PRIPA
LVSMGSIRNNPDNLAVGLNNVDISVTDESKSSASRRDKGSQLKMSSGGTSSTKYAAGVPPPIDKYDSSKLKTYGSFPFDFLTNITKEWKCAYSLLSIKDHDPNLELGRSDVLVLKCGHFIHAECIAHFMNSETTEFKCSQCSKLLLQKECSELPIANHLLDLRKYLNQRGIACSDCHSNPPKVFAPDLMYVCMECTNFKKLNECLKEYKYQKPIFMDNCPKGIQVLTNGGVQRQLSGDLQVIRICLFCRTKKEGDHFNHPLKRISSITAEECELIHNAWINTKNEEAKPGIEYRIPWHVVMVDFNWIFKILTEYFQCCCGKEYESSRTSNSSSQLVAMRPAVNIVKCAHLSCDSCWQKIRGTKKPCPNKNCNEQLLKGSEQRYVKDLEFISKRKLNDYERCIYCEKFHPKEFMRIHTTEDKENIVYCAFCFDHLKNKLIISTSQLTS